MTENERKRNRAKLDETRQLTRPPGYYLTDLEGSECHHLEFTYMPEDENIGAKYLEICEGVDNEIRD